MTHPHASSNTLTAAAKFCSLVLLGLILGPLAALGQNITWSGGNVGTDVTWSDGLNWVGGVAPVANNALFFDGTTGLTNTNNLTAATGFNGLTFNATAGNFTLNGNSITLNGNITSNAAGNEVVNLPIVLGTTANFTTTVGTTLTLGGVISGGFAFNAVGPGNISLTAANTFTSGANILGGTLAFNNATGLGGTSGTITLNGGTLLNMTASGTTISNPITVTGTSSLLTTTGNSVTYSGIMTVNAGAVLNLLIAGGTFTTNSAGSTFGGNGIVGNGTIELGASTGTFRMNSASSGAANHGGGDLTMDLGTGTATLQSRNGAGSTYSFGALEGGSGTFLRGAGSSTAASTYNIGNNNQSTVFAGSIQNGQSNGLVNIIKVGTGNLSFTGSGNYSGTTTINLGTLSVANLAVAGANSSIGLSSSAATNLVISGGTLQYIGSGNTTDRLFTIGAGGANVDASGSGAVTFTNAGSLTVSTAQANLLTLTGTNTGTNSLAAIIPDQGTAGDPTSLTKSGVGQWDLSGHSTYTGVTTINNGILGVASLDIGGNSSSLGASNNTAVNLVINGGTLKYTGAGNTTDRLFTIGSAGSATLDSSGTGPVVFNNSGSLALVTPPSAQTFTLTLAGTNTGANTLASVISNVDPTNTTALVKNGAGNWTLSAPNTFSGGTVVNAGTLVVTNASGSATGTGPVSLASGAGLAGNGTIAGAVTANAGAFLSPGTASSNVGLLTLGSLTLAANSGGANVTMNFDFSSSSVYDQIDVTGLNGLTINGGALNLYTAGTTNAFATPGTYNLFQFNGAIQGSYAGSLNSLIVLNANGSDTYTFGTSGSFLTLTIASLNTPNTWNVPFSGAWSNANNWTNAVVPAANSTVNFQSAIASPQTVTLDGSRNVAGLFFNNFSSYTIGAGSGTLTIGNATTTGNVTVTLGNHTISAPVTLGANGVIANITGAGSSSLNISGNINETTPSTLTKTGNGLLVLSGNNTYSGGTNFNGGTTSFAAANSLGTGPLGFNGGSLQWNGTNTADISTTTVTLNAGGGTFDTNGNNVTLANSIGNNGAGNLTKAGNGVLVLQGANTYSGGTNLNGGTLSFSSLGSLGTGTAIGFNGGALQWNGTNTADITNGGATTVTLNAGGGTLDTNGNNVTLVGSIGNGGTGSLAKIGNGTLNLLSANAYSGNTSVTGGTLGFASAASLGSGALLSVSGGTLQWNGTSNTADISAGRTIVIGASGATFDTNGNNATLSTPVGGAGPGDLTKVGNGNLTLSAAPTYTGNTVISGGTLTFGSTYTIPTTSNLTVNTGGTVAIGAGATLTTSTLNGAGNISLTSGGFTLNTTVDQTFAGSFSGTGGITKAGTGNLTLIGISPSSGALNISAGNVNLLAGGSLTSAGGSTSSTGSNALFINGGSFTSTATFTVDSAGGAVGSSGVNLQSGNATFTTLTTDANATNAVHPYIIVAGGTLTANTLTIQKTSGTQTGFGEGGLVVSGGNANISGTVTAASNNSNGQISVEGGNLSAGTLVIANQATAGRGGQFQLTSGNLSVTSTANGGFVVLKSNATVVAQVATAVFSGGISNLAQLTFGFDNTIPNGSSATVTLSGGNMYIGPGGIVNNATSGLSPTFNLSGGNLGAYANWSTTLPLTLAGTGILTQDGNGNPFDITLGGVIAGTAGLSQTGGGNLSLTAANTYSGVTTINGGTVAVAVLANGLANSGLGSSSSAASNVVLTNGGLRYTGSVDAATDRAFTLAGSTATFSSTGTGNVTFSNPNALVYQTADVPNTVILRGGSTAVNTFGANLTDNGAGATSLLKTGAGAWIATGDNTLSGPTTVNSGTLTVNTLPNSSVTVNAGGALNPAVGVGTLTVPALTLGAGNGTANATLNFDFSTASPGGYDQLFTTLTNGLTLNGGAFNLYQAGTTTPWATTGVYDLIGYSGSIQGSLSGNLNGLAILDPSSGLNYAFSTDGSFLILSITGQLPADSWAVDADGVWSNPANWSTGVPASTATVNFLGAAITAPRTVTLDGDRTVAGLNFSSSSAYTLGPGAGNLSLVGQGGPANVTVSLGSHTISAPVVLDANGANFNLSAPGSLAITGNIGETAPGAILMNGTGVLALSGNNTYSGGTFLNAGLVNFNGTASLGLGNITFNGGGLQWAAGSNADISALPVFFNGSSAILDTNGNNVTLAGSFGTGSTGSLTKTGNGVLTLAGANTYAGGTNLLGGEINFTTLANLGTGALVFNGGGLQWATGVTTDISTRATTFAGPAILDTNGNNVTLANPVGNSGAGGLVKTGNGVLTLAANATYTGTTTVNGGTLIEATATAIPALSSIVLGDNGTLDVSNLNATLNYVSGTGLLATGNTALTLGVNGAGGNFAGNLTGTGSLNKSGPGTQILSGTSAYAGAFNINGGTLEIGPGASYTSVGTVTAAATNGVQFYVHGGTFTTASLLTVNNENLAGYFQDGGVANLNGGLRVAGGNDGASIKVAGGTLNTSTINLPRTGNVTATNTPYTTGFIQTGGVVNVSGNVGVGTGTSYASASIQGGSFNVAGAIILGDQSSSGRGGVLQVIGGTLTDTDTVNGLVLIQNTGVAQLSNATFGGGTSTFNIVNFGLDSTVQNGTAAINVTGGNLYIGSGGLNLRGGGSLSSAVNLASGNFGATASWSTSVPFNFNNGNITAADSNNNPFTLTLTGAIGGTGALNKTGSGTVVLASTGTAQYSGNTVINAGTLQVGNGGSNGSLGSANTGDTITNNATLIFDLAGVYALPAPLGGTGTLVQNGSGTTQLTLANTYSGPTVINAGTLEVTGTAGTGAITVNNGGVLSGNATLTNAVTVNTGGAVAPGNIGTNFGLLTLNSLTLGANGTVNLELGAGQDQVIVANSGGLSITHGGLNLFQADTFNPFTTPGTYSDLIQYSGSIGGLGLSSLYIANAQLGLAYNIFTTGTDIGVTISQNTSLTNAWAGDTSGSWSDSTKWQNITPVTGQGPSGVGITVNLPAVTTVAQTILVDQNATLGTLNFGNPSGYDLADGGGSLTLRNSGSAPAVLNVLSGNHTVEAAIALTANGALANISANTSLALNGLLSGPGQLTKNGNGVLTLADSGSFSGGTVLNAGTLILGSASALGTGNFTLNGGNLDALGAPVLAGLGTQFWNASFTFLGSSGLDLGSGPLVLNTAVTVSLPTFGTTLSLDGPISGSGQSLTAAGPGTLDLNGTSTFNGGLTLTGNALVDLGAANALASAGNVTVTAGTLNLGTNNQAVNNLTVVNGSLTGTATLTGNSFTLTNGEVDAALAGPGSLTQNPGGLVTLTNTSTYTGTTTLFGGNTVLASGANNRLPATTTVALGSSGNTAILFLGDTNGASNQTLAGLTGPGNVRGGFSTANSTLDLVIPAGDSIFTGVLGDGTNSTTSAGNHLALIKDGPGEFDLQGGNSTFLGGLTLNNGTLGLTAAGVVPGVGPLTFNGGALLAGNATTGFSATYPNALVIPAGVTAAITTVGLNNQSFSGAVSGSGTLGLTLGPVTSFTGNLQFSGFNGTIALANNGTLRLQNAPDHGLANTTINLGTNGTLANRDGGTQSVGTLLGAAGSILAGSTGTGTGNTTWSIGALNTDDTFNGNITNGDLVGTTTSLTKTGTANLTLTGTASYIGNTTLSSGMLIAGSPTALSPNSTFAIAAGATLRLNGQTAATGGLSGAGTTTLDGGALTTGLNNATTTYNGLLSGLGALTKAGLGTLTLTANNTFTGPTTINAGTLNLTGSLNASDLTINPTGTLTGTGLIGGNLTLNPGGTLLLPSPTATLSATSLTWNTNGTASIFDPLGASNAAGLLKLSGNLAAGSGAGPAQFIFDFENTGFFPGVYTLLDFAPNQALGLSSASFAYLHLNPALTASFTLDNPDGTLTLTVSPIPEPAATTTTLAAATLALAALRRRKHQRAK